MKPANSPATPEEQKIWFEKLVKDREDSAKTLEKPSMSGVKHSIVEKYSDQAHFIYELLQNANDAQATKSMFHLTANGLYFRHNGTIGFSVSNPDNENNDKINNSLGHINSITSIANSNKTESSIGKFGVGFKAVFQYTETPHIYDRNFQFKIERFIVPKKLEDDLADRKLDETVFFFPFDKKEMSAEKAYKDILGKLIRLIYPTLFLSSLQEISWKTDNLCGNYAKKSTQKALSQGVVYEKIELNQLVGLEPTKEDIWLFTRFIEGQDHSYSVGYFADKNGGLIPKRTDAFCFFPTKENTGLNFIVHAPFLLTDSREGIKKGLTDNWNEDLIKKLAQLAADSLLILKDLNLIDDDIIRIIPYKQPVEFFSPFYYAIKEKLFEEELLPSINGEFTDSKNAYWASAPNLPQLFSNERLAMLYENEKAKWIFHSLGYNNVQGTDRELASYIANLSVNSIVNPIPILGKINSNFIQNQSFDWMHKLYEYLSENKSYQDSVKTKPIFKDSKGNSAFAFNYDNSSKKHELVLFLPTIYSDSPYKHIHPELLKNEKSKEFIENFGIKEPSLKDEIYNRILPLYKNDGYIDTETHFKKFFQYWKEEGRPEDFIDLIKDKEFVSYKTKEYVTKHRGFASEIYYPSEGLLKYFETKRDSKFVDLEDYHNFITDIKDQKILKEFLLKIGVSELPRILEEQKTEYRYYEGYKNSKYTYLTDKKLDGSDEVIENINFEISKLLWSYSHQLTNSLKGYYKWDKGRQYYDWQSGYFESTIEKKLKTNKWLFSINNEFVAPHEITINELADGYERDNPQAKQLAELLNFKPLVVLTEKEKIAKLVEGRSEEEIKKALELFDRQNTPSGTQTKINFNPEKNPVDKTYERIRQRIEKETPEDAKKVETINPTNEQEEIEEDEYIKPTVDFDKKRKQKEDALNEELEEITKIEKLTRIAEESKKYSFAWFKALLELECLNSNQTNSNGKEISIRFAKAELEKGTERTLVLKNLVAPRYIPIAIEEIGDIRLKISFGKDELKTVTAEVVNVKEFTLRCKLKNASDIQDIDLEKITSVQIDIKNPVFMLEKLLSQFKKLPFKDGDNLKNDLTPNIEFIFGPPGTGKTTYLAKNVLIPKMQEENDLKFLVLTPTNKAADVLTKRIIREMEKQQDESYADWLVRFGITQDNDIQQSVVFKEKNFDIRRFSRNVTVTTIARFPYDSFTPENLDYPLHLQQLEWDFIVVDEASMIMLAQIMYPLCYKCDSRFIIAGDPFQIQPITTVENWKDENIYTLVELNNFANPTTVPYDYEVINLEMQYRSVPSIGEVFSQFTYNGILKHSRTENEQRPLNIRSLNLKSLNLVKFPASRWEGIYRSKRLNNTPYHIYSALFTYEFAKYLSSEITKNHRELYRIGIICPYRAQASLVDKLVSADKDLLKFANVELQVGTIHGFQGDECDIIISLFNPPPTISSETHEKGKNMFLHKQNILNVSISRPRDYLFILMPDDKTENLSNLKKIRKIENLIKQSTHTEIHSQEIENIIFGKHCYLEENTFSTTHQSVNVYSDAEKLYEIRCEETAIDIQIKSESKTPGKKL